ncbi:MAG TPA: hypothetical protein VK563_19990 [Puia sp.]|nr:hypothetical protein [Puia sp.]
MYDVRPNLIFGFHGCDESVRDRLLNQPDEIIISKEKHDWLGHGMYFWENNHKRALQWAQDKKKRGKIKKPSVVGAILFPGYCCDFLDSTYIYLLKEYFEVMSITYSAMDETLPENRDLPHDRYKDKVLRELDCAVIEFMHGKIMRKVRTEILTRGFSRYKVFDSSRGVFTEGGPVFSGAGILEKSHIQICIRNPNCIKGFFLPRKEIEFPAWAEGNNL